VLLIVDGGMHDETLWFLLSKQSAEVAETINCVVPPAVADTCAPEPG
jgi:hypothetical protein